MQHSFDMTIAQKYGVNVAIFLNNLAFWIHQNAANNKHFHDGRYWTYNSMEAYTKLFPYWTINQIRKIIDDCLAENLIIGGNYNKNAYDRTKWYAFTDEGLKLFPICQKTQMDESNNTNGDDGNNRPIPDINTDIKTDIKKERGKKEKRHSSRTSIPISFYAKEEHELLAAQLGVDVQEEKDKFIDYHLEHGNVRADWNASFRTWLRKCKEFKQKFAKKEHHITKTIRELKEEMASSPSLLSFFN